MNNSLPAIGSFINDLLAERSWSMGHLSALTHIDKASISRIINGKRKPTLDHLQKFSQSFGVPLAHFLEAAGYPATPDYQSTSDSEVFRGDFLTTPPSPEQVRRKLYYFEQQAKTDDGKKQVAESFEAKVEKLESSGPHIDQLKNFYHKFHDQSGSPKELALIGAALLYFIAPIDVIPDYIFPLGYVDDVMAVQLVLSLLQSKL